MNIFGIKKYADRLLGKGDPWTDNTTLLAKHRAKRKAKLKQVKESRRRNRRNK